MAIMRYNNRDQRDPSYPTPLSLGLRPFVLLFIGCQIPQIPPLDSEPLPIGPFRTAWTLEVTSNKSDRGCAPSRPIGPQQFGVVCQCDSYPPRVSAHCSTAAAPVAGSMCLPLVNNVNRRSEQSGNTFPQLLDADITPLDTTATSAFL